MHNDSSCAECNFDIVRSSLTFRVRLLANKSLQQILTYLLTYLNPQQIRSNAVCDSPSLSASVLFSSYKPGRTDGQTDEVQCVTRPPMNRATYHKLTGVSSLYCVALSKIALLGVRSHVSGSTENLFRAAINTKRLFVFDNRHY